MVTRFPRRGEANSIACQNSYPNSRHDTTEIRLLTDFSFLPLPAIVFCRQVSSDAERETILSPAVEHKLEVPKLGLTRQITMKDPPPGVGQL
jgi:hypothetical protein